MMEKKRTGGEGGDLQLAILQSHSCSIKICDFTDLAQGQVSWARLSGMKEGGRENEEAE